MKSEFYECYYDNFDYCKQTKSGSSLWLLKGTFILLFFIAITYYLSSCSDQSPTVKEIPTITLVTDTTIYSKDVYINGNFAFDTNLFKMQIKGRGNTTWDVPPKKSYKVKFSDKQGLFGYPSDKEWALLANWFDKSLLRNDVAFELSERLNREWTPKRKFIDVNLNDEYHGNYLLTETIKSGKDRVNIDLKDGGYLLEVNAKPVDVGTVRIYARLGPTDIKEGTVKPEDIRMELDSIYQSIFSFQWEAAYKKFDLDAFVTWYLVNEIMKNHDAAFYSSVYIQKNSVNDKVKMGPVWDFDFSSGNVNWGQTFPEGWYLKQGEFTQWVWRDYGFQNAVKAKWNEKRDTIFGILGYIKSQQTLLETSASHNFKRWDILDSTLQNTVPPVPGSYDGEVDRFYDWMKRRLNWIDSTLNK